MTYLKLFLTFLKIGAFTFGGGYAMIPLISQEVIKNGWLTQEELINFIAISESTPGPIAVNVSTFVGMQTGGILGALCASIGVVFPSFVIILLVARIFEAFRKSNIVSGAMLGLKGAVVGLIGAAIITTAFTIFEPLIVNKDIKEFVAAVVLLFAVGFGLKKKINPILLILLSAIFGIVIKGIL